MNDWYDALRNWNKTLMSQAVAAIYFTEGMDVYGDDFLQPLLNATETFAKVESKRFFQRTAEENIRSYFDLFNFNIDLMTRYAQGTLAAVGQYNKLELNRFFAAVYGTLLDMSGEKMGDYFSHHEEMLRRVVDVFPEAIKNIEPEYGFHFERYPESLVMETDRFSLRQVRPSEPGVVTDDRIKPVLIIPPFVLGANILSFLPHEKKSYAHSFANKGIPTYIRIMKDIDASPAVQTLSLEEDARDTAVFCRELRRKHGSPVTLNGYCQGGFSALCNLLSGELDGLVDALITCVAPMDGTRSDGLGKFLRALPGQFNDLAYGTKTLANGNRIADGDLMGWVYKLKSIENSGPMVAFFRDIMMLTGKGDNGIEINKTVAALNYWLQNERSDLPLSVTEMSFRSYNTPISGTGVLPITMFGKELNLHAIKEKNIRWLLCYGESDDLVEKEVALAPLDFLDIEVTPFPKGHVAIATSWSHPDSSCALDSVFGEGNHRGPVRFHLDLAAEVVPMSEAVNRN